MKINKIYLLLTIVLFVIEVCIASNFYNKIIRNYIGDVLVIMLIYCFLRSFFRIPVYKCLLYVLIFACSIETLQYFNLLQLLGLQDSKTAALILGRNFSWIDIGAYFGGAILVAVFEMLAETYRRKMSGSENRVRQS